MKFDLIDEEDIPIRWRPGKWKEIFSSIPPGKALIIPNSKIASSTIRTALSRYKGKGKYQNFLVVYRSNLKISYIINPKQENKS